jgi:hypothetical protein
MSDLLERIRKLHEWNDSVNKSYRYKHQSRTNPNHDQSEHGNWAEGMGGARDGVFPSGGGRVGGGGTQGLAQSLTVGSRNRRGQFMQSRAGMGVGGVAGGARSTIAASSVSLPDALTQLIDDMNDLSVKPSAATMGRYLINRGLSLYYDARDVGRKDGGITKEEWESLRPFSKSGARWSLGVNFFKDIPLTNEAITPELIASRSASWQRAYGFAIKEYTRKGNPEPELMASRYADHIDYLTGDESPFAVARNFGALHYLDAMTKPVPLINFTPAKHDASADMLSGLRRILSATRSLWMKYKGGDIEGMSESLEPSYRDTILGRASYEAAGDYMVTAMRRGRESIYGYLAETFPDMNANTFDVMRQMTEGYGVTRLPDKLVLNSEVPVDMYELPTPYENKPAESPSQYNKDEFVAVKRIQGYVLPESSAKLLNAMDKDDFATLAQTQGRQEMNGAVLEAVMEKSYRISQETGIPVEIVSAALAYWQNGTQMIDGYPAPMLVRLQDAAAELFGLQLGEDGNRLNDYQQMLLDESNRIATRGGRQWRSESKDSLQRTEIPIEHLFYDWFERKFDFQTMQETSNLYTDVDLQFPQRYLVTNDDGTFKLSDDMVKEIYSEEGAKKYLEERKKATPEQLTAIRTKYDNWYALNKEKIERNTIQNPLGVPNTPYDNPQQARKAFIKHMYDETQKFLRDNGIGNTTLYRSINFTQSQLDALQDNIRKQTGNDDFTLYDEDGQFNPSALVGQDISMPRNALESWTADLLVASSISANIDAGIEFNNSGGSAVVTDEPIVAELVVGANFDPSRMVSVPPTGFGMWREGEVVVTGNKDEQLKVMAGSSRVGKMGKLPKPRIPEANVYDLLTERMRRGDYAYWYNLLGFSDKMFDQAMLDRRAIIQARAQMINIYRKIGFN